MTDYKPGDIANGHVLGDDLVWRPVDSVQAPPASSPGAAPTEAKGVNGTVRFDGQFVTIARTGFMARATVGKGDKRIPVRSITAVQWKSPGAMVNGYIAFTIAGGNESRSRFGTATFDAVSDENSVVIQKKHEPAMQAIRTAVEAAIAAGSAPTVVQQQASAADELSKYAALRDQGILTEEEFAAKKAQILGL